MKIEKGEGKREKEKERNGDGKEDVSHRRCKAPQIV